MPTLCPQPPPYETMPENAPDVNCDSMTLGLFRTKFAAMVAPGVVHAHGLLGRLVPNTRRTLSHPFTSATPLVSVTRTIPTRREAAMRSSTSRPVIVPLKSPLTIVLRPTSRVFSVAAGISMIQRAKRLLTRGQLSKTAAGPTGATFDSDFQNAAMPASVDRSGAGPSPS